MTKTLLDHLTEACAQLVTKGVLIESRREDDVFVVTVRQYGFLVFARQCQPSAIADALQQAVCWGDHMATNYPEGIGDAEAPDEVQP